MEKDLLINEFRNELNQILRYWKSMTVDDVNGGFYGLVDINNVADPNAVKGIVLNTRILWTFSAAFLFEGENGYKLMADRAYRYIKSCFFDRHHGGVFWSVDFSGKPLDKRKQVYAHAFAIYALSEYFKITDDAEVLDEALEIYRLIESHSSDNKKGGYIEAFDEQWNNLEDVRLGENDLNERKTMNTHLHILEAYTNLYRINQNEMLRNALFRLINVFTNYIIDKNNHHLNLFFDENWQLRSTKSSYGHDIEAAWLLYEAAEIVQHEPLTKEICEWSLKITNASVEGLDKDGGLMNEYDHKVNHLDSDKHWWPQAEAMVGFLNAFQLTHDRYYYDLFLRSWEFVKKFIIDHQNGEWYWRVDRNGNRSMQEKAGFWKCPYHNTRACIEIISRLNEL